MNTILALQPHNREIGYAVFEGNQLVDWGMKGRPRTSNTQGKSDGILVALFRALIKTHSPQIVVLAPPSSLPATFRSQFVKAVREESVRQSIEIREFDREAIEECFCALNNAKRVTKESIAQSVVRWFPELQGSKPKRRRLWERQDYWMPMFDAVSLAVTLLYNHD